MNKNIKKYILCYQYDKQVNENSIKYLKKLTKKYYCRAHKVFGHLNARRCDFNINIIIPTRKPPLSVRN